MTLPLKDIDRPLGLTDTAGRPRRRLPRWPSRKAAGTAFALLALIGASAAIALRDRPFERPPPAVAEAPAAAKPKADPQTPKGAAVAPQAKDSASIVHLGSGSEGAGNSVLVIHDPAAVGQNLRVAHLPDRALVEDGPDGLLPVRAADGRRPFDVYARPWSGARGARVALVIGGLAVSQTGTQDAIRKLPAEVTLGFAPQGNSITRWMQEARRKGHEIVLQLPLEPFDYPTVDPGRNTLTVEASPEENIDRLHWVLSRTTNYTGVMNYMGARFSGDAEALAPVMSDLGKRGLLYLDDGSSGRSQAEAQALKNGVPFAAADTAIDGVRERGEILKKLDELERTARAKGFALGTGSAFDVTIDAVTGWVNEAKKRGVEIVPVSALANDPERG